MHGVSVQSGHVDQLQERVKTDLSIDWPRWPGGWPGEIELALVDAVFSMRTRYEGVLMVVERWRKYRGSHGLDDLDELARFRSDPPALLAILGNRQRVPGGFQTKADAVVDAAARLSKAGGRSSTTFDVSSEMQRRAYTSVKGLGVVTWAYLGMLLGQPGVKADTMIRRFVARALDRPDVEPELARRLVASVAERLDRPSTELDYAIWVHERSR